MPRQNTFGKWYPIVYDKGLVQMVELINDKWVYIECDTKEEAEELENQYNKINIERG